MGLTTFDTLKFVRRLEEVGVPSEQAEVQAEVLTEAFNVNLEELVTKDYMAVEFAKERAYIDTRFAEERAHSDSQFAEIRGNFRTLYWILGVLVAATVMPLLERLLSF